jgi:transposase InsO family protein
MKIGRPRPPLIPTPSLPTAHHPPWTSLSLAPLSKTLLASPPQSYYLPSWCRKLNPSPALDTTDNLHAKIKQCGKIFILDMDMMWLIGHIPTLLAHHAEIFSLLLDLPSPLLQHYPTDASFPDTLQEWTIAQQQDDPQFTADLTPDSIFSHNNLTLYRDPDFPSRIVVPTHLREKLARKIHVDLHHLSAPKVLASLSCHYFWSTMAPDTRRWLADCPECDNAKAKRRLAHGLFHGKTTPGPRSRYSMDFQGQGLATTGESEALALLDSFTKTAMAIPLPDRLATTLALALLKELHFRRGPPTTIHSDAAPEFLSDLLTSIHAVTGPHRTTTLEHDPASNGELESWWRYWNRCMRFLTPAQYLQWSQFAQRICYAYNSSPHSALDQISPLEMDSSFTPLSPYAPPSITFDDDDRATEANAPPSTHDFVAALRITTAAFHHFAKTHLEYTQRTTAARLNQCGSPASFNIGDKVKIYRQADG